MGFAAIQPRQLADARNATGDHPEGTLQETGEQLHLSVLTVLLLGAQAKVSNDAQPFLLRHSKGAAPLFASGFRCYEINPSL